MIESQNREQIMNEELPENHAANVETMKRLMIERRERLAAGEPEREITCTNYTNSQKLIRSSLWNSC